MSVAFALSGTAGWSITAVAQATQAKALDVRQIANERERDRSLPRDLTWNAGGDALVYVKTAISRRRPSRGPAAYLPPEISYELWQIDAKSGSRKLMISAEEIKAALGLNHSLALTNDEKDEEEREENRQFKRYALAPNGHAVLLSSSVKLAWFDLDTHSARSLYGNEQGDDSTVSDAQISPDGRFVSFISDHALQLVNVKSGVQDAFVKAPTEGVLEGEPDWSYYHELGLHSAYWWSHDSSAIAWLESDDRKVDKYSMRSSDGDEQSIAYPKPGGSIPVVHLFVRRVTGGKPVEIVLGSDANAYIPRVVWAPDGKHLAVERLSRNQQTLELLLADTATGKTRVILSEKDAYWINLNDDLRFLGDSQRLLWSSERSGYRHLYLYDIQGHQLAQLTHGNWEVTSVGGEDETQDVVYFTSTEVSPMERQLYRVHLDGSGLERVTQEKGTHDVSLAPNGRYFVDTWSNHATRPHVFLRHADGGTAVAISDANQDDDTASALNSIEFFTVKTHMSANLNAWMMKPPDFDPAKRYPVIFFTAGGPGEQIVRDAWGGDIFLWLAMMAQKGYIVLAIDNRGSAGYGHLFEEPLHLRFGASEMADVRDGVLYLHSQPWVDKSRIGICGWNYGGFLALHGMLDRPVLFKAGFAGDPITDWRYYNAVFDERYLGSPVSNLDGYLSSSPIENATNLNGPLLIAYPTRDEKIHPEHSLLLLDELLDKGKYADTIVFPDRSSLFEEQPLRLIMFQHLTDFFEKNL